MTGAVGLETSVAVGAGNAVAAAVGEGSGFGVAVGIAVESGEPADSGVAVSASPPHAISMVIMTTSNTSAGRAHHHPITRPDLLISIEPKSGEERYYASA